MLFSEATGRPVLSTGSASTVGTVDGFLVDPAAARVVALRLKNTEGDGDTVHWEDLTAFGADAVTVPGPDAVAAARGRAAELDTKSAGLLGKRLLTDAGAEIGSVVDVAFDPATGRVESLLTGTEPVRGDRLVGCGSYAAVVRDG
ncbi:MAG TPA: PRC-barrel domain-containing protein [Pilimelia sp.]|nr:PRC-barrel domain-containing protein [Pilimelia sp.]